jgi:hypothetical protein
MKKQYKIKSQEEGRGKVETESFATLAEASRYIQDRWQGFEYRDGNESFHTDYCTYLLVGFTFKDIGKVTFDEPGDAYSARFIFNDPID